MPISIRTRGIQLNIMRMVLLDAKGGDYMKKEDGTFAIRILANGNSIIAMAPLTRRTMAIEKSPNKAD